MKAIIFDMDGTTLDTLEDITDACNLTFKDYGLKQYTPEEMREKLGYGFLGLMKSCFPETMQDKCEEAVAVFSKYYADIYKNKTKPYDGILETMKLLQERKLILAINSNKDDYYAKELVKVKFPGVSIAACYGKRKDMPGKPDPSAVFEILKELNLNKEDVLYVGDSEADYNTAKNAGIAFVGVTWGYRNKETLKECGVENFIDRPQEIINYL